jgi:hypothetical protein
MSKVNPLIQNCGTFIDQFLLEPANLYMRSISAVYLLTLLPLFTVAQGFSPAGERGPEYPVRAFLNKFSINLSSGYGHTFYEHTLDNYSYVATPGNGFITGMTNLSEGDTLSGVDQWHFNPVQNQFTVDSFRMVSPDSSSLLMNGGGNTIPLHLSVYYNLYRFRIGGGAGLAWHQTRTLSPYDFGEPPIQTTSAFRYRYYLLLGYSAYEYLNYAFAADVRVGRNVPGNNFNKAITQQTFFVNVGISVEKVVSEYFRLFVRPSWEFRNYSLGATGFSPALNVNDAMLTVQFGVSINYPDLPRSPIKSDKTQLKHYVSDPKTGMKRKVRGQPFWKKQNPKVGELYPELKKTKFNKRERRKNKAARKAREKKKKK